MSTYTLNPNNNTYVLGAGSTLLLPADQTVTSSTTVVEVPELTIVVGPYERVWAEYVVLFDTVAAADFKYIVDGPGSPTRYRLSVVEQLDAATSATAVITAEAERSVLTASATEGSLNLKLLFENGATAGDIAFKFAQATSNAGATVVEAGSHVDYRRF